jgi:hypothetical protein
MPRLMPTLTGAILIMIVICLSLFLLRTRRRQQFARQRQIEKILAIQRKIHVALADDGNGKPARKPFSTSLEEASLITDLQRPRLEAMAKIDRQAPEKYRIFAKMAARGVNSTQAAAILGISPVEAAQLLNLCQMVKINH